MSAKQFDIRCENFYEYFAQECNKMLPEQKAKVISSGVHRLFTGKGKVNEKEMASIGMLGQMYILYRVLKKEVFILVADEGGIDPKKFMELAKRKKNLVPTLEDAQELIASGMFVLSGEDLVKTMTQMHNTAASSAYNYLKKARTLAKSKSGEWRESMEYIVRFLITYENYKTVWCKDMDIDFPEFAVLLCLYDGREIAGSKIYKHIMRNKFVKNGSSIRIAFLKLFNKGFISKRGATYSMVIRITALGMEVVDNIILKYTLNC